jgi:hypothetical protein
MSSSQYGRSSTDVTRDVKIVGNYDDEVEGRVEPGPNPFAAKVLPMSPE